MIAISVMILNPFVKGTFKNLFCKAVQITEHKFCELELTYYSKDMIGVSFDWTTKTDHAGVRLEITLFTFTVHASIYDNRHWNSTTNNWKIYYPDGTTDDPDD